MKAQAAAVKPLVFSVAPRTPFPIEVSCSSDPEAETRTYLAWNLSKVGLYLKTMFPHQVGTTLTCKFKLPDGRRPVTARGKVVWNRTGTPSDDAPPGMGIRFYDMSDLDRERLVHFVTANVDMF